MPRKTADFYAVDVYSGRSTTVPDINSPLAKISFYKGRELVGNAQFFAEGTQLDPRHPQSTGGQVWLQYHISQLQGILTMIKDENPIFIYAYSATRGGIATGIEPVGEEES